MSDKRRHLRRPIEVELRCQEQTGVGTLLFDTGDLSPGGAFVKSDLLLEQGEELQMEFLLPPQGRAFRAKARVAWVRRFPKDGEPGGMGIEFVDMAPDDRKALERFLQTP